MSLPRGGPSTAASGGAGGVSVGASSAAAPGAGSAQAWEESLAQMSAITDQNLAKMASLQRSYQPAAPDPLSRSQLTYSSRPPQPVRAQSAPRNASRPLDTPGTSTGTAFNPNLVNTSNETERKLEFLMKRTRQLEEKIKRSERGNAVNNETASLSCSAMEQLLDTQKSDKKTILTLRENMQALKNQMEQLQFRDEVRDKASQRSTPGVLQTIDIESIKEVVFHRVQTDFNRVIEEVVKACATEQATYLSTWAEREKQERVKAYLGGLNAANAVSVFQAEMSKLQSDLMRLKGRQDAVDNALIELRDIARTKETELEMEHRKAISSYRTEFQIVVDSIGRNVNEQLSLNNVNSDRLLQVEQDLARHENEMIRLGANQQVVDDVIGEVKQAVGDCSNKVSHALNVASLAESDCRRSAECAENVMKIISQHQQQQPSPSPVPSSVNTPSGGSFLLLESRVDSALDNIHSLQSALDRLSAASLSATGSLEERIESLSSTVQQERLDRQNEGAQAEERVKKIRTKLKEVVSNMTVVSAMREKIDQVLVDLSGRQRHDDEKLNRLSAAIERNNQTVAELTTITTRMKEDFRTKISQLDEKIASTNVSKLVTADLQKLRQSVASQEKTIDGLTERVKTFGRDHNIHGHTGSGSHGGPRVSASHDNSTSKTADFDDGDDLLDVGSVHTSKSSESDDIYSFKVIA
jgi:hypothetical protein